MVDPSTLSPDPVTPDSPHASLVHSTLPFPGIYCLWLSPSIVNLVTFHSAVMLKHQRAGAESLLWVGLLFPSGCNRSEGSGVPEHDGCCRLRDDPTLGSLQLLFCSLHEASVPSFSSGISCSVLPCLCWNPG